MNGWVGLVGWTAAEGGPPVNYRSAGRGKFAGQNPTFYHCSKLYGRQAG